MNLSVQLKCQLSIGYEDRLQRVASISVFYTRAHGRNKILQVNPLLCVTQLFC